MFRNVCSIRKVLCRPLVKSDYTKHSFLVNMVLNTKQEKMSITFAIRNNSESLKQETQRFALSYFNVDLQS